MSELANIPTLDDLLHHPEKIVTLPPEVARTMLIGLAAVQPLLLVQSLKDNGKAESPAPPERWLTVEEVMAEFKVSARWLYSHKKQLPYSQPSRKTLLFDEHKLRRWFQARKTG